MRCRLLQNKVTGRTLLARSTQEIFSEVSSARWAQERKRRSAAKAEVGDRQRTAEQGAIAAGLELTVLDEPDCRDK